MKKIITINARKFDGKIHRSWNCELINQIDSLLIFVGKFVEEVRHFDLGIIRPETISYEYYWLDRWYNVFRFHEPEGDFRNYYCNVNTPPTFKSGVLDYIDLDIDVLISKDFKIKVLDFEEFETNSEKFGYSEDIMNRVQLTLDEIIDSAQKRKFPFDFPH